jgi:acyl-CoA dehydrogenase
MNFEFSEEQNLLREQAISFLNDKSPLSVARRVLEGDESHDEDLWRQIAELGWTATTIPEKYNGLGLSYLELCVLAEELGRALTPIPFSSSVYLATEALLLGGTETQKEAWLPRLAEGQAIGTVAIAESAGPVTPKKVAATADGGALTGTKIMVPDGGVADFAVVLATAGGGSGFFLVDLNGPGVERNAMETIDPSRSHARITFHGAACEALTGDGFALRDRLFERAAVLFAFEQVGGSQAALDMARDYAMGRYAFGRPIATYQAIKHKLARMYVARTLAQSNAYYGAWALSTNALELGVAAATARVSATQAFRECTEENIQTHGGMGFTWEFDCHLYYRRSKLLSVNLGSEAFWKDKLITCIEAENAA